MSGPDALLRTENSQPVNEVDETDQNLSKGSLNGRTVNTTSTKHSRYPTDIGPKSLLAGLRDSVFGEYKHPRKGHVESGHATLDGHNFFSFEAHVSWPSGEALSFEWSPPKRCLQQKISVKQVKYSKKIIPSSEFFQARVEQIKNPKTGEPSQKVFLQLYED